MVECHEACKRRFNEGDMISDEYRAMNAALHKDESYGTSGSRYAQQILALATSMQTQDILDYGCGKSTLSSNLPFRISQYDPAIEKHSKLPKPADLVVCTDVLEHVEPEHLETVLAHLRELTKVKGFLIIATRPAKKILSDGRNAHLTVETPEWWLNKLWNYFKVVGFQDMNGAMLVIVDKK